MTATGGAQESRRRQMEEEASPAWQALGAIGFALFVVGLVDLFLAWTPLHFGTAEWEFGTISTTLNNMPVPAMGLALILAHATATRRSGQLLAVSLWSSFVVLVLGVSAVFYGLDVPLALRSVQDPLARHGLKIGMVKGIAAFVAYGVFHLWSAVFAFRRFRGA